MEGRTGKLIGSPARSRGGALALSVVLLFLPGQTSAEITFRSRTDVDVGTAPASFALLDSAASTLLVANDEGLAVLRNHDGDFVFSYQYSGTRQVKWVAAGALDQDGQPHVAFGSRSESRVSVMRTDGHGGFGEPHDVAIPTPPRVIKIRPLGKRGGAALFVAHDDGLAVITADGRGGFHPQGVAAPRFAADFEVADLNGDGQADLLVVAEDENQLAMFEGIGGGVFRPAGRLATQPRPRRVCVADANRDSRPDLFVVGANGLVLWQRDRLGGFSSPKRLLSATSLSGLALGDVTGDGLLDVAVVDRSRGTVSFLVGTANGKFALADSYVVHSGPEAVLLADLSGNGRLDAVVLNQLGNSVTVLRNLGGGTFDSSHGILSEVGDLAAVTVADFDRDSHLDLAVTSGESGRLGVFLGDGGGRFAALPTQPIGGQPRDLVAGSFDADDAPDLAIVKFSAGEVAILSGDGRGGFAAPILIPVGLGPTAIASGSFGGTGRADLAVANLLSDSVSVLYGTGSGFAHATNFPVDGRPSFLMVADADDDGHQDLIVGNDFRESVDILHGTGRRLSAPQTTTLGSTARPSLAEDFDGDGLADLVIINEGDGTIDILPGTGPGIFGARRTFPVGRDPQAAASGDFDDDGRPDLAVIHRATGVIAVLLNRSVSPVED